MDITAASALGAGQIERLSSFLAGQPDVLAAYLFGSYARSDATPLSDVDVAVLVPREMTAEQAFDLRLALIDALQGLLHREAIDVVVLNEAPLALRYRVLRDGKVLACRDEQVRILFQADTISRYLDFKPVIEQHERAILDRARRGELFYGHNPYRGALARYRQQRQRAARAG